MLVSMGPGFYAEQWLQLARGELLSIDGSGTNAWSVTADQTNLWRGNVSITGAPTLRTVATNSHLHLVRFYRFVQQ